MKFIPLIFALFIIFSQIVAPVAAAGIQNQAGATITALETRAAYQGSIDSKEFSLKASGSSGVLSNDIELETEKIGSGLRISSTTKATYQKGVVDSHNILVPVTDIQDFNGHSVRITHFDDTGIQDDEYIQEVTVQDGYIVLPDVEFSSIIVDGFTGSKTETSYNVNVTDYEFEVTENGSLTITLGGVDDGVAIDENDSSTYPDGAVGIWNFYNSTNIANNELGTPNNVYFENGSVVYNATDSRIVYLYNNFSTIVDYIYIYAIITPAGFGDSSQGRIFSKTNCELSLNEANNNLILWINGIQKPSSSSVITLNESNIVEVEYDNNTVSFWVNGVDAGSVAASGNITSTTDNVIIGNNKFNARAFDGTMDKMLVYNTPTNRIHLDTGYSGTSAKLGENGEWQHPVNGVFTFENVTTDDTIYFSSAYLTTADSVTKLYEYTQDYTLIEESETADNVQVQINATAGANMSESQLVYDVASLNFTYLPVLNSTNPNATVTIHNQTLTFDTGILAAGSEYLYNVTLSKLTEFLYSINISSKTSTKVVFDYNSTNSGVPQDIDLYNMSASSTFDLKYPNGTILMNATTDSSGYVRFDDAYPLYNGTGYEIEKQTSATTFVGAIFVGLSFVGLYFANRFRRRNT